MQQPIYWPAQSFDNPNTYQKAYESINVKDKQGGHPRNDVASIFSKADRVADYQHYPSDALNSASNYPDAGAQVSFSGCLIENVESLAAANDLGYGPGWNGSYVKSRQTTTSGGHPKLDLVAFGYHHPLVPLTDPAALKMELATHKIVYEKTWGPSPGYSKGFFPSEMSFTERAIPTLVEAGVEWVIVSNSHISRACKDYPFSTYGDNNDPPNMADAQNPAQSLYFNESISRGCTPNNAVPFSYRPHYAEYTDPVSGNVSRIIVVPAAMALSWVDSTGCSSTDSMQTMLPNSDPDHPMLFLLAHDGDNAFSGGYSYYNQCYKQLLDEAAGVGIGGTTIEQYLQDFPPDESDVVHVEDGSWVNSDGDFGAPNVIGWLWPPVAKTPVPNAPGKFDPQGWSPRAHQYAAITAALNRVLSAEAAAGGVDPAEVQDPSASANNAELAWHFFLPALTSGYEYYGNTLDLQEKPTVACNAATKFADMVVDNGTEVTDTTPPSVFAVQRAPWNPGGMGAGSLWAYKHRYFNTSSFDVWTFIYDMSGVSDATLYVRTDSDLSLGRANHVYEPESVGLKDATVGDWKPMPMTMVPFPDGDPYNTGADWTCDNTDKPCFPTYVSDLYYYTVDIPGPAMADYYVSATDKAGNTFKSPVHHVFINGTSTSM